ncbi:MAG: hypothetical protein BMS9Abin33_0682 [Gammaproteobacteria bacterium]|nr:MAG: hypothetical protein BMS9Abin33_0682 [Gammaproteobacteria bacterium]
MMLLLSFRLKAVLAGQIEPDYLETVGAQHAPGLVIRLTHNLANLFEFPLLFYMAGTLMIALNSVNEFVTGLAWTYVALRYIHSVIHITYNKVLHRASIHAFSDLVLVLLWFNILIFVVQD